jgi:trimeric autotransporter adhesin
MRKAAKPGRHRAARREPLRAERIWWWPYLVIAVLAALLVSTGSAHGGFTGAVADAADQARTGSLITAAATGGSTECDLSTPAANPITTANSTTCSGDLTPALSTTASTTSLATTVSDKGSLSATSGSLISGACGPIELANAAAPSDPMLVRGTTISYAQTGPLTGGTGLGLNGNSGYAADVTSVTPPTAGFTELIWFKVPSGTTTGGTLLGLANTPTTINSVSWDRALWLDNTGHVVFGAYNGAAYEATTTTKYNDGNWHLAVATVSATAGMSLYVDNAAAVTNSNKAAEAASGYWHVGWDNESSGWTNPPTDLFFTGTLADAAVIPTVLSTSQISNLYTAGSQTTWNTRLAALAPTYSWTLGDDGNTAYTGTVPSVTPAACAFIDATVATTTTSTACAYPTSSTACAAPSITTRLSTLAGTTKTFGVSPTTGQAMTITVTLQRDTLNTVTLNPYAAGLHITLPLTVTSANGTFSATLTWAGQDMLL